MVTILRSVESGLGLVWRKPVDLFQHFLREFAGWSRIKNQGDILAGAESRKTLHSLKRDFQLRQDHTRFSNDCPILEDILWRHLGIRSRSDSNAVLPFAGNQYDSDSRWSVTLTNSGHIHPGTREVTF
jgi:hypothetical protein